MSDKLPVHRDQDMEKITGLSFDACAAYYDGVEVRVVGEVVTRDSRPIADYREVQVVIYDEEGDILGRNYTNWTEFQIRQSFEVEIEDLPGVPYRVKVFPSKG